MTILNELSNAPRIGGEKFSLPTSRDVPLTEIRPGRGLLDLDLKSVWAFRELLASLVNRDVKVLYRQAVLGIAWAVVQPVFAVTIFSVVFGHFAKIPSDGIAYPVFAFAGVLPWTYFAEAVRRSSTGLVQDAELVRKIYFPRLVIPVAAVIGPLIDFSIGLVVLLITMVVYGVEPSWRIIAIPPLILMTTAFALAVGLWLGPTNVRFRDIKHTLPFLLQIWMYASPIIYPLSLIPAKYQWVYSLNPMVGVIEGFRWALVGGVAIDPLALCSGLVVTIATLTGGLIFFKYMERSFADVM